MAGENELLPWWVASILTGILVFAAISLLQAGAPAWWVILLIGFCSSWLAQIIVRTVNAAMRRKV